MDDRDVKVCSHCKHSKWNEEYKDVIPSIYMCLNPTSDFYGKNLSWMSTCKEFEYKEN